jgi:protein SCO1/2
MLPADLKRTKALFISLDPERDDVEVLKQYTGYFHPNILGLTEDITVVIKVAEQYGIKYKKTLVPESALGYVISHSSDIIVLGLDGKLRRTFPHNTSVSPLKEYIIYLLNENL